MSSLLIGVEPAAAVIYYFELERFTAMAMVYNPLHPVLKGDLYRLDGFPFPNEDSPLTDFTGAHYEGEGDFWELYDVFPSSPELWLVPGNYDP